MSTGPSQKLFEPLQSLQREFGKLLDSIEPLQGWLVGHAFPCVDLVDGGDRYVITVELPGMTREQVDLSITGDELRIKGERPRPQGVSGDAYRLHERHVGPWERTIAMPERVDSTQATATFAQGVLTVILPKAEEARPRRITITPIAG
jgi:HSP20 family protein